jgi:hypothetical protein
MAASLLHEKDMLNSGMCGQIYREEFADILPLGSEEADGDVVHVGRQSRDVGRLQG